jgi:glycosyltransferase involved in cell wall biosynthesis
MRILLVTDAWEPQINGVCTTVKNVHKELNQLGHEVLLFHPGLFWGVTIPGSGGVKLCYPFLKKKIARFKPDRVHIFTEGTLGFSARRACAKLELPFTTGYHTKFPEILNQWYGIPIGLTRSYLRYFHSLSKGIFVPTRSMKGELISLDYLLSPAGKIHVWGRGVDSAHFSPPAWKRNALKMGTRRLICVSRAHCEKNLEDFCALSGHGYSCTLVGGGSYLDTLKRNYPKVNFTGSMPPADVGRALREADIFVFPSKADTFGLVMLEANACGLPVVGYPVTGPKDWIKNGKNGYIAHDTSFESLKFAVQMASIHCAPKDAISHAEGNTWEKTAQDFLALLHPCR